MTEQDAAISQAMTAVGSAAGADVAVFIEDDELHFDPISVAVAVGGVLLAGFVKGLTSEMATGGEDLGHSVGRWLRNHVSAVFKTKPDESKRVAAGEVGDALSTAQKEALHVDQESVRVRAAQTRDTIATWLMEEGISEPRAAAIAAAVYAQGVDLLARQGAPSPPTA